MQESWLSSPSTQESDTRGLLASVLHFLKDSERYDYRTKLFTEIHPILQYYYIIHSLTHSIHYTQYFWKDNPQQLQSARNLALDPFPLFLNLLVFSNFVKFSSLKVRVVASFPSKPSTKTTVLFPD